MFEFGDHGGTHSGNPLMCAVGLAVMQELSRPAFLAQVRQHGETFARGLKALAAEFGHGQVRGRGLLWALELGRDQAPALVQACHDRGLLVNAARPHCLRLMPPLNLSEVEMAHGLGLLGEALESLRGRPCAEV